MSDNRGGDWSGQVPPITDPHEVAVVVKAVVRIAKFWRLSNAEAAALIGVPEVVWDAMRAGTHAAPFMGVQATRAILAIGIWTDLHAVFSEPLATDWPTLPNRGPLYGGRRPLDVMIGGGVAALAEVRGHVAAIRWGA